VAATLDVARRMSHGAQLDERVTRLARALAARGVGRGDRVAVHMTNRLEVVEAYLAACRLGAIAVPVNFRLVADEINYILTDAGPTVLLTDHENAATAAAARVGVATLRAVLVTGGAEAAAAPAARGARPTLTPSRYTRFGRRAPAVAGVRRREGVCGGRLPLSERRRRVQARPAGRWNTRAAVSPRNSAMALSVRPSWSTWDSARSWVSCGQLVPNMTLPRP
jgi:acyl-CoA synthetase (AMP-forming)/AMP-acid ligase II